MHVNELDWVVSTKISRIIKIGQKIKCKIINLNKSDSKIFLSFKQTSDDPWLTIQTELPIGKVVEGVIKLIKDYGIFICVDEKYEGLIHISEISWNKLKKPLSELFVKKQKIKVVVQKVDKKNRKIAFSHRLTVESPWEKMYKENIGKPVEGVIKKTLDRGLIVKFPNNLEGFLHYSQISWGNVYYHQNDFSVGNKITTVILGVSSEREQLRLGSKQLYDDPWPGICNAVKTQEVIEVKVVHVTKDGIVVSLRKDIEGFIHNSHLVKKNQVGNNGHESYQKNDRLRVVVQNVNPSNHRVLLSERLREDAEYKEHLSQYRVLDDDKMTSTIGDHIKSSKNNMNNISLHTAIVRLDELFSRMNIESMKKTTRVALEHICQLLSTQSAYYLSIQNVKQNNKRIKIYAYLNKEDTDPPEIDLNDVKSKLVLNFIAKPGAMIVNYPHETNMLNDYERRYFGSLLTSMQITTVSFHSIILGILITGNRLDGMLFTQSELEKQVSISRVLGAHIYTFNKARRYIEIDSNYINTLSSPQVSYFELPHMQLILKKYCNSRHILIVGEQGSGKMHTALLLHYFGTKKNDGMC